MFGRPELGRLLPGLLWAAEQLRAAVVEMTSSSSSSSEESGRPGPSDRAPPIQVYDNPCQGSRKYREYLWNNFEPLYRQYLDSVGCTAASASRRVVVERKHFYTLVFYNDAIDKLFNLLGPVGSEHRQQWQIQFEALDGPRDLELPDSPTPTISSSSSSTEA